MISQKGENVNKNHNLVAEESNTEYDLQAETGSLDAMDAVSEEERARLMEMVRTIVKHQPLGQPSEDVKQGFWNVLRSGEILAAFSKASAQAKEALVLMPGLGGFVIGAAREIVKAADGKPVVFFVGSMHEEQTVRSLIYDLPGAENVRIFRFEEAGMAAFFLAEEGISTANLLGLTDSGLANTYDLDRGLAGRFAELLKQHEIGVVFKGLAKPEDIFGYLQIAADRILINKIAELATAIAA